MTKIPQLLKGWTVLVVDDEEDSQMVAAMLLKMSGATVYTANNGREGLDRVHELKPDFILSDLSMPEMDGWRMMFTLNNNRATIDIPVIALTAHAMTGDCERAISGGFINYLTKPLDPDKFIQQLLAVLVTVPQFHERLDNLETAQ